MAKLAAYITGTVGIIVNYDALEVIITKFSERLHDNFLPEKNQELIRQIFRILPYQTTIVPASSNPRIEEQLKKISRETPIREDADLLDYFSTATLRASEAFCPIFLNQEKADMKDCRFGYRQWDKVLNASTTNNILALGSPTSNYAIRTAMFYDNIPDKKLCFRMDPEAPTYVTTPYQFALDEAEIMRFGNPGDRLYHAKGKEGQKGEQIPNWGLKTGEEQLILPKVNPADGLLLEDFLVISMMPNTFHPDNVDRNIAVICIGGTHSLGTIATKNLLQSESCLQALKDRLESMDSPPYWQAVFRIELEPFTEKFSKMSLMDAQKVGIEDKTKLVDWATKLYDQRSRN